MSSRVIWAIPIFFTPAIWNMTLEKMRLMPKQRSPLGNFVKVCGVALGLSIAMPLNCALYPQMGEISVNSLEPEI